MKYQAMKYVHFVWTKCFILKILLSESLFLYFNWTNKTLSKGFGVVNGYLKSWGLYNWKPAKRDLKKTWFKKKQLTEQLSVSWRHNTLSLWKP